MGFAGRGDMRSHLRLCALLLLLIAAGVYFVQAARTLGQLYFVQAASTLGEVSCELSDVSANWKETNRTVSGNIRLYFYKIQVTNTCKSCDVENVGLEVSLSGSRPVTLIVNRPILAGSQVSVTTIHQESEIAGVRVTTDISFVNCPKG